MYQTLQHSIKRRHYCLKRSNKISSQYVDAVTGISNENGLNVLFLYEYVVTEPHLQQPGEAQERVDASCKVEQLQRNKTGYIILKHTQVQPHSDSWITHINT